MSTENEAINMNQTGHRVDLTHWIFWLANRYTAIVKKTERNMPWMKI